ncbi:MAG: hypothetical protein E7K14_04520 [Bacillota bacterium]|nr:hypothetical protein [Bacillota bacterium]
MAYYSLQPFGRENQNLVNLVLLPDEFILSEAQGKVQETGCGNARVNVDKHSAVLRHAGKSLPYQQASDAAPSVFRTDGQKTDPAVLRGERRSSRKLLFHAGAKGRISGNAPFHGVAVVGGSHAGEIVPDVRGHFHPGGKIRRHGRTNESRGMDGLGRHRTADKKPILLFGKDCREAGPGARLFRVSFSRATKAGPEYCRKK